MTAGTRQSLRAVAVLWYTFLGLTLFAVLGNAWLHGFGELLGILRDMRPLGWLVLAALIAPGPLAHWLSLER